MIWYVRGFAFTGGVLLALGVFGWLGNALPLVPYDSTDSPPERSGMGLRIDAMTGCHYLSTYSGLTPRMDTSGKHICEVRP